MVLFRAAWSLGLKTQSELYNWALPRLQGHTPQERGSGGAETQHELLPGPASGGNLRSQMAAALEL